MLGINGWEFVVLAIVGLIVLGPDKLPKYVGDLARLVRRMRRMAQDAQDEVRRELGPEFADLDIADLDPRKFVSKHLFDIGLDDDDDEPRRDAASSDVRLDKADVRLDKSPEHGTVPDRAYDSDAT